MGKWESGEVGKWENGKMGKWENGKMFADSGFYKYTLLNLPSTLLNLPSTLLPTTYYLLPTTRSAFSITSSRPSLMPWMVGLTSMSIFTPTLWVFVLSG
jgi:hypothetical protein